ncbi:hypothetical protein AVEN_147141-1 [Araneus ventricosus]|uniref:DDE-1 domain-containing protein n=1 Tax=Araneus ventricosus TaxID=182803 RepID=A0A4Y2GCD2_ARAVE|nr:hypothetical protein AVEN_147141-1 [Araneus ventricosus]
MLGDFETPVVIGKAKKPRCFKNTDGRKLSVSWKSNKKAWMTTEIMSDCTSEVATDSTTERSENELADLVANLDSNVSVEEYVKIDDDLSIEEEDLHVSNFIHRDTTEALALFEDDDEESPMEDCKIKDYSEALKYSEQLKQFFLNNEDSEGLAKLNPMKIHLEKQVCCVKKEKSIFVNRFFK